MPLAFPHRQQLRALSTVTIENDRVPFHGASDVDWATSRESHIPIDDDNWCKINELHDLKFNLQAIL